MHPQAVLITFTFLAIVASPMRAGNASPQATRIGTAMHARSDGIFLFITPRPNLRLLVEQSWDGDARLWRYSGGRWRAHLLYQGLGQCFSPLVADCEGTTNFCVYLGSWEHQAGIHRFPLSTRFLPCDSRDAIPGSASCGRILCLRAAPARNDGVPRLYVGSEGPGGGLYEFTKVPHTDVWIKVKLHAGSVGEFAVGTVRGDKLMRIYAGDRSPFGQLYEFTWLNRMWHKVVIVPALTNIRTVALGDGRGDGKARLYVNAGEHSWEVSFVNNRWLTQRVGRPGHRYYILPARTPSGARVFSALQGVGIFQWLWRSNMWHEQQVDAVTSATGGIAVGDGRGDGKLRLYVANGDRKHTGAAIWEVPLN